MRNKLGLVILGVALGGLSGCSSVPNAVNPISWYRDVTGASKDDNLGNGENQQNLDEGSKEPYPNLANVPAAPDTQLSGVDRDKLVDSLIADRNHAQYSADNLRAGEVADTVPPPPPPAPATAGTSAATVSASTGAAPPPPAAPSPPASQSVASSGLLPPAAPPAAPPPAASASPPSPRVSTTIGGNAPRSLPPRGSEAPPAESSLQSPTIPNVPEGTSATPVPVPSPPQLQSPREVASAAPPPAASRGVVLHPPTQQASAPADTAATGQGHHSAISYRVGDVSFAPGSAYLSGALRGTIAEIVKLHNEQGGMIRIVGFGEASGKDAAVAGLTLALDRAQAVAVALTDSGVAAKDINVEAAPVPARGGADAPRAEIYLEQ